ncbi:MAG: cation-translocating P-type ATPase [Firmicutes bacterium]|nr:cation-translocating P-type ATPase [Bacillota bacterium]
MYNQNIEEINQTLNTSLKGLTSDDAKERLKTNGKNAIAESKKVPAVLRYLKHLRGVLIIILLIAAALEFTVAVVENSTDSLISAIIILTVVALNATIAFVQETNAEKSTEALKNKTKSEAKVLRDGSVITIKTEDLVIGDIVLLEAGDIVPADLRLFECASLQIEESALTGESVPSDKTCETIYQSNLAMGDRRNMAFMQSVVTYGRGRGIVVATGMHTQIGLIAGHLNTQKKEETPLQKRLHKTNNVIAMCVALVCGFIFISRIIIGDPILNSIVITIAIAVCSVPEALPMCITITMSLATQRMSKRKAIVRNLTAVEALGSTEVICSDKTGTITLNKMTVQKMFAFFGAKQNVFNIDQLSIEEIDALKDTENFKAFRDCMLLCNDTQTSIQNGILTTVGDPTETALVHYMNKFDYTKDYADTLKPRQTELPFDSQRKLMSTVNKTKDTFTMHTKGATASVLERCTKILDNNKVRDITASDIEIINNKVSEFALSALRVLAYAYKPIKELPQKLSLADESNLIFVGISGMIDPPRAEVFDSIKKCKTAGIKVVMITGDHKDTAFAIAQEIGIVETQNQVVTGAQLNDMTDEVLTEMIKTCSVFARVNPEHKVRIVAAFKASNKVVAMTGDGVNDAPSIKAADIGIGMGITGTDVTKQVADVILTDDNFATIVDAVEEGRRTYSNIKKIIIYLVGLSLAELVLLTVIIGFFHMPFFNPILILWVNLITDTLPVLALGTLNAEKDIMNKPPNKNRGSLFKGLTGKLILVHASFMVIIVATTYFVGIYVFGFSEIVATTMSYVTLAFLEGLHSFALFSSHKSMLNGHAFDNKWLNLAVIVSLIIAVIPVLLPITAMQNVMGLVPLNATQWAFAISISLLMIVFVELHKIMLRAKEKRELNEQSNGIKNI